MTTTPLSPAPTSDSDERFKSLMHSFLSDFFSQSQLGTNSFISAPPAVPHCSTLLREATGGIGTVTPFEAPPTETPGKALPMTQVDHSPSIMSVHNVSLVRGVVSSGGGGSPSPSLSLSVSRDVTDQLCVTSVTCEPSFPPLSALSPSSFLYPLSHSGFVSLYSSAASLSSSSSVTLFSSASASVYTSSFTPLSSSASSSSFSPPPLSYPPWPSVLSPAAGLSAPPPPPPGFPPLPPGFSPLSSFSALSSSSFSSSLPLSLSTSSVPSPSLLSVVSSVSSAPVSSLSSSAPFGSSSSPDSSSLDYTSFKAHVLGI